MFVGSLRELNAHEAIDITYIQGVQLEGQFLDASSAHIHTHTYTYIHTHTYIHTYVHICIHTGGSA